ncbi:MAG TPA: BPSS1780 family membrane protein [Aggregatilineaceae bacterium]|nr:BPSS1780 family membrane protein [Aggregatilineaceae bacterium]
MNDPVVIQLRQAVTAHGAALLQNPAQLEQLLAASAASFPGKVKALLILLDKKAVTFLTTWSNDTRPNKGSYEQVRQQIATKFEQAKLLSATAATWGLDAWAAALGLCGEPSAAAPAPEAKAGGLSLVESETAPAAAVAPVPAAPAKPNTSAANPYAPPAAPVSDPADEADQSAFIPGGRGVVAGRGWSWFAEGWQLFKQSPMIWIVNFIVFMLVFIAIELVPFIGGLAGMLLAPVLGAGIMIGARAVHQGEALEVAHLFAGFRERTSPLMMVGVLNMLATMVIVVAVFAVLAVFGVSVLGAAAGRSVEALGIGLMLGILIVAGLSIPLMMAYWFAPALVPLNGFTALEAMKMSFSACLKNVLPFLVYGVVGMLLAVAASIPAMLGWFILVPVWMASMYTSYRDIFYDE